LKRRYLQGRRKRREGIKRLAELGAKKSIRDRDNQAKKKYFLWKVVWWGGGVMKGKKRSRKINLQADNFGNRAGGERGGRDAMESG